MDKETNCSGSLKQQTSITHIKCHEFIKQKNNYGTKESKINWQLQSILKIN